MPVLMDLTSASGLTIVDGHTLIQLLVAGLVRLTETRQHLNKINVFPIADGVGLTCLCMVLKSLHALFCECRVCDIAAVTHLLLRLVLNA